MIPGSANPLLAFKNTIATDYQVSRSVRFNGSTARFDKLLSVAGNRKTWTVSMWVKRSGFGAVQSLFASGALTTTSTRLHFTGGDELELVNQTSSVVTATYRTTAGLYRDPSAWMHIVAAVDTTQATAANRIRLYVNGTELTAFTTSTNPALNLDLQANTGFIYYGTNFGTADNFNGYLTEIHFINGLQLTPSSFGQTDANTGQWIPIAYTGAYGTNGHKLTFADNSSLTALGSDSSGNANNFTATGISITAGVNNDSLVDSPTNYGTESGAGGDVRGNYCTWNPIDTRTTGSLSNGNMTTSAGTTNQVAVATFGLSSGLWYWELTGATNGGSVVSLVDKNDNASSNQTLAVTTRGFRLNASSGLFETTLDGTSWSTISTTGLVAPYFLRVAGGSTLARSVHANFGQRPFTFSVPAGYKSVCSQNFPTPTIARSETAMDVVTYAGTGATQTPTSSLAFAPDLVWIKRYDTSASHAWYDSVRGTQARLESNNTNIEATADGGLTSFNSNGFTLGSLNVVNNASGFFVAWCWDAGTSTVTNTAGTITSQVRANPSAGFSIATYTGNGVSGATVGHGLGVAPQLIITKNRSVAADWQVATTVLDGSYDLFSLNLTDAKVDSTITAPTSTVVYRGNIGNHNDLNNNYVMYSWAPVAEFSSFGRFAGNGNVNGTFVYTGFRPKFVLIKKVANATNWALRDSVRLGYNPENKTLSPNLGTAEASVSFDILSNGFKIRESTAGENELNKEYFYAAFAEEPFSLARAR